jgi:aldose 1-epimerase
VELPWGLGTHPYFKLPLDQASRVEDCLIEVPANARWELENCLPTGRVIPVNDETDLRDGEYVTTLKLDDVYTQLESEGPQFDCMVMDERAGLQVILTCPPIFREIVAFTPPNRAAVCLEPYTCPTDAINLQAQGCSTNSFCILRFCGDHWNWRLELGQRELRLVARIA